MSKIELMRLARLEAKVEDCETLSQDEQHELFFLQEMQERENIAVAA